MYTYTQWNDGVKINEIYWSCCVWISDALKGIFRWPSLSHDFWPSQRKMQAVSFQNLVTTVLLPPFIWSHIFIHPSRICAFLLHLITWSQSMISYKLKKIFNDIFFNYSIGTRICIWWMMDQWTDWYIDKIN